MASGRKDALGEARALIALASSLSEAGDALTESAVAEALGVSEKRAGQLIELVLTASAGDGQALPLVEEAGGVTLAFGGGLRGRRLCLGHSEALAVAAALERLGVSANDPLRAKVEAAASAGEPDPELVERLVGNVAGDARPEALLACARACSICRELRFIYSKPDGGPEARRVLPERLWNEDARWYLDAWDLERDGERTFRLDRMAEVAETGGVGEKPPAAARRGGRLVELEFRDSRYLGLLPWHELSCDPPAADGSVHATTPWYGGDWLPRMVCACGGSCTTTDTELAAAVRDVARRAL